MIVPRVFFIIFFYKSLWFFLNCTCIFFLLNWCCPVFSNPNVLDFFDDSHISVELRFQNVCGVWQVFWSRLVPSSYFNFLFWVVFLLLMFKCPYDLINKNHRYINLWFLFKMSLFYTVISFPMVLNHCPLTNPLCEGVSITPSWKFVGPFKF